MQAVPEFAVEAEEDTVPDEELILPEEELITEVAIIDPAILYYERIGKSYPLKDAESDLEDENYTKVLADAEKVLKDVPDSQEALKFKAYAYHKLGQTQEALNLILPVWESYPFAMDLKDILTDMERTAPSVISAAMQKEIAQHPSDSYSDIVIRYGANKILADTYIAMGRKKFAIDNFYPEMVKLAPTIDKRYIYGYTNYDTLNALAWLYLETEQPAMARRTIDEIIKTDQYGEGNTYIERYYIARNEGNYQAALDILQKIFEENGNPLATEYLIKELINHGKYAEAIKLASGQIAGYGNFGEEEVEISEFLVNLYLLRGYANFLAGNKDEATSDFMLVNYMAMEIPAYYHMLAITGEIQRVEKSLEINALSLNPLELASLYSTALLYPDINENTARDYKAKALSNLSEAYKRQLTYPTDVANDIFLRNLTKLPEYPEVKKHFDPSR